ncbi:MAG: hypothetical protein R2830_09830 [Saprospiraceae bacterium]
MVLIANMKRVAEIFAALLKNKAKVGKIPGQEGRIAVGAVTIFYDVRRKRTRFFNGAALIIKQRQIKTGIESILVLWQILWSSAKMARSDGQFSTYDLSHRLKINRLCAKPF